MIFVAAVSNLASAAGDWQSVSSRDRPHKRSQSRVEREVSRGAVLRSAKCSCCSGNKTCCQTEPLWSWLILGAFGGNPRVAARELLQYLNKDLLGLTYVEGAAIPIIDPPLIAVFYKAFKFG